MTEIIENNALNQNEPVANANHTLSPTSQQSSSSSSNNTSTSQVADFGQFIAYIKQFVPALLDTSPVSNLEFEKSLEDKSNVDCLRKFLADSQTKNLIFHKFYTKGIIFCRAILNLFYKARKIYLLFF